MVSAAASCARRAVFLDRDGTLNVEKEYLHSINDFEFVPGAQAAIARLKDAGFLVVVVTNQSGVGRGYYDMSAVEQLHGYVDEELARAGTSVDGWYVCPHFPAEEGEERCSCRKPQPGMLLQAAVDLNIDLAGSFMIGDKLVDVQAAKAAGCIPLLVRTGYGIRDELLVAGEAIVADHLPAAVEVILSWAS